MALTKQEIMLQIAQGKIQTALENLIQLSGQLKDKEMQQRAILLFSQLSQLKNTFGNGTIDNKTYQLELNRITEASLQVAQELPAGQQHVHQAHAGSQQQYARQAPQSGSGWKTWGILLTGAGGLLVILVIVAQMMNPGTQDNTGLPQQNFKEANPASQLTPSQRTVPTTAQPIETQKITNPHDKYVGVWQGTMNVAGMVIEGLTINLNANNQYASTMSNPADGSPLNSDQGTWTISENGLLVLRSVGGMKEVYNTNWVNNNLFNATFVDGTNQELIGLAVVFSRRN